MCLLLIAHQHHPDYRLVVAANRDEYYQRPSEQAAFWGEHPSLLAGRDRKAGGTWLGVSRDGRFAAITNVREPAASNSSLRSRGELPLRFLLSKQSAETFLQQLRDHQQQYAGFNLVVADPHQLLFFSNRGDDQIIALPAGIHGISNGRLNEDWPKVNRGKALLQQALDQDPSGPELMQILSDRQQPADEQLPNTGVGLEMERVLAPCFIQSPTYGTRCSTVVMQNHQGEVQFAERSHRPAVHKPLRIYRFNSD